MYYCKIENGVVANRTFFDGEMKSDWPDRESWIASEEAQIGWSYADGSFTPPEVEPKPATFPPLSPRQVRLMMLQIGLTTSDIETQIAAMPDSDAALIEWDWATQYERDHPLVALLASALGFTEGELDVMWNYAAGI